MKIRNLKLPNLDLFDFFSVFKGVESFSFESAACWEFCDEPVLVTDSFRFLVPFFEVLVTEHVLVELS